MAGTRISELEERLILQLTDLFVLADADEAKNFKVTLETLAVAIGQAVTPPTAHNSLSGIQGGATNEYYHLTEEEYNNLGITGTVPFFLSNGTKDNISLLSNKYLPFFLSNGTQDNINIEV